MNKIQGFLGTIALTLALPFTDAAADGHRERDFRIPAQFFAAGALPGTSPQPVPIYCNEDFNWQANPARPEHQLLERIDTLGFGGGQAGTIAFLLMNSEERADYLGAIQNNFARTSLESLARQYDLAPNKTNFLMNTMQRNHQWNVGRFSEISNECERRELNR